MLDGVEFGNEVVALVRGYVEREVAPLKAENAELKERLAALEARQNPEKGEPGEPGTDGVSPEPEAVAAALLPVAEKLIAESVSKAVAALPPPEKGEPGERGEPADPAIINEMVLAEVQKAVAALPAPKNGEDGKDAAGIVEALKDNGELVLTLQDGRLIRTGVRDGAPGKDGRDGFSLEDFDCRVLEDDRTIELSFRSGDHEHIATLKWPTVIDRGVYKAGEQYAAGDATTWGGSLWIAQRATDRKPDTSDSGWRLAVKRGRDGKDAKVGC
jgi:integrin beta 3